MQCPECGATVGAEEKFCGNCGTPLQNATSQASVDSVDQDQPGLGAQPLDHVESPPDPNAGQAETEPTWDLVGQETAYSEPAPFAQESSASSPPLPIDDVPAAQKAKNTKIIIAIVVLVVLLLCCCSAVIIGILFFGTMEEGQSLYMVTPSLTALL